MPEYKTKESRFAALRVWRDIMPNVAPGDALEIEMPELQPGRRDFYTGICGHAFCVWGKGGYKAQQMPGNTLRITRLSNGS